MRTVELFCGTKSFSKVAQELGHQTYTTDIEPWFNPDLVADMHYIDVFAKAIGKPIDVLWASPPCQAFSIAAISKNWSEPGIPKSEKALDAISLVEATLELIKRLEPTYWFIENPVGMLRQLSIMHSLQRDMVTYCQYGDTRMKPTDIWHNAWGVWIPRTPCSQGDKCHEAAPRGSKTGTQGLKNARDRGVVPPALIREILESCSRSIEVEA